MVVLGILAFLLPLLSASYFIAAEMGRRRRLAGLYEREKRGRKIVKTPEELDVLLQELGVPAETFLFTSRDEIIERLGKAVAYHTVVWWPLEVGVEVCTLDHYCAGGPWFKGLGQGAGCLHYVDERIYAYSLSEILLHKPQGLGIWRYLKNL